MRNAGLVAISVASPICLILLVALFGRLHSDSRNALAARVPALPALPWDELPGLPAQAGQGGQGVR